MAIILMGALVGRTRASVEAVVAPTRRPSWATAATLQGSALPNERMDLRFHLRLRNRDAAVAEASAVTDPRSPRYGRFLTTAEFRARYAPTEDEAATTRSWLEAHGLVYDYAAGNRLILAAHGTVAAIEAAFATPIGLYRRDERVLRAPMITPRIPAELARLVVAIGGLHDADTAMRPAFVRSGSTVDAAGKGRAAARRAAEEPATLYTAPPPLGARVPLDCAPFWGAEPHPEVPSFGPSDLIVGRPCAYTPPVLRRAYELPASHKLDGSGITIAVVEAFAPATSLLADVQQYAARNDPTHPFRSEQLELVMAPGADPATPPAEQEVQGWYVEETLDVEAVHAFAPEAKILLMFTKTAPDTNPAVEALNHIIDEDLATIVSNSYADPELYPGQDYDAFEAVAIQANLKGIGLYFAAANHGDYSPSIAQSAFPASLPQVTAVGGTSLGIGKNGRRVFDVAWESTASFLIGGAWVPPFPGLFLAGGGGGPSSRYARPNYQEGVVPDALAQRGGGFQRVVPDVSLIGNNLTGFLVGLTQSFPDGVYYDEFPVGGTSLATPLLSAVVALAEQKRGRRVGFINPTLYEMRRKLVRDVVPEAIAPGSASIYANGFDATAGVISAAATLDTEMQSLHTTQGYDATTGLGVPRVRQLIRRFGKR